MNNWPYKILFSLLLCLLNGGVLACGVESLPPLELLGKNFNSDKNFNAVFFDGYFMDHNEDEKIDRRFIVIDKERRYFRMETSDYDITSISWDDPLFVTSKNIRIGDTYLKVREAYPNAKIIPNGGDMDLYSKETEGDYIFGFNDDKTLRRVNVYLDTDDF